MDPANPTPQGCPRCGGILAFDPAQGALSCGHCGSAQAIQPRGPGAVELDLNAHLRQALSALPTWDVTSVTCASCGARTTLAPAVLTDDCPYCGSTLRPEAKPDRILSPQALLPFQVDRARAELLFRDWVKSLWFAPSDFTARAYRNECVHGLYIPYWTFDCRTRTSYMGMRGDDYQEEESYTETDDKGHTVTRTRTVTKTTWWPTGGTVTDSFDDVLVLASESLPRPCTEALEPWDLEALAPMDPRFLAGFRTEIYRIDLQQGFLMAQDLMRPTIRLSVERDIGGDHQQIISMDVTHEDVTFKHILLPIWASAYRYRERAFRFVVNGRTGEVQGERPWSWIKLTLLAVTIAAIIYAIYRATQ